ncbi:MULTISPECIES: carbohydrate kinase family protein [Pasteurellaceae]|uniref:carbohydrate kinase family protein n=1 Tax=Pasteurellaceae TaxID=712 RepID=UPI00356826A9
MTKRKGILAIGNVLVDRTLMISDYPQETMLATISHIEQHCGGGCTNVLFNLAKLDPELPLYLSGAIGDDAEGQFITQQALQHHVNTEGLSLTALPTSFTDVMINSQSGERTFFHYVGAMSLYGKQQILRQNHPAKIAHIAYLPLLPALLNHHLPAILQALRDKGLLISIDLVSVRNKAIFTQHIRPALPYIDFAIINEVEAKMLTDNEGLPSNPENLLRLAHQIQRLGVKNSVIVHCPEWAVACNRAGENRCIPSYWVEKQNIVSTLGAGDAFCAGCLYGLHQNMPLQAVLQLGHSLAYFNLFSVSATGGAVSYPQVQQFLRQKSLPPQA